jgi:hypothetical protein
VHGDEFRAARRRELEHRAAGEAAHVVDEIRAERERAACVLGVIRVDAEARPEPAAAIRVDRAAERFFEPGPFLVCGERRGAGARGFCAEIDELRAGGMETRDALLDAFRRRQLAAVAEGIGREVHDAHPERQMPATLACDIEHGACAEAGHRQQGRERGERRQHERALRDARVRDAQALGRHRLATPEQDVEIDRPGCPAAAVHATELALDCLQAVEHVVRRGAGRALGDDIEERLVPFGGRVVGQHGRRFHDGRYPVHAYAESRQSFERARKLRSPVSQVRPEP